VQGYFSSLAPSTLAQWVGAIATSSAVVVALFKDEIIRRIRKPVLVLRVLSGPPDCVKTPMTIYAKGNPCWQGDAYFLRVWIENSGKARAEKVQVFVKDVLRQAADGTFKPLDGFLPMNLRWSHTDFAEPEVYADGISPGMGKHCDFAAVSHPDNPSLVPLPNVPHGHTTADLYLEVFPATLSHRLPPGAYRIQLLVAAANSRPAAVSISLTITGEWFADERQMLSRGIGIAKN
jgi:hypothetical protein